ncbi:hypothetical protein KAR91_19665 [Candidatus Pacearchaeota archaeon]|nr:hypothetical protein [Candidatus Pacearchaeota archaeon]
MGILSDLTPAIFKVQNHEIKARVLTLTEVMTIIKEELSKTKADLSGAKLDKLATHCLNEFEFSDPMAARLIFESVKDHTEGFDMDDAQLLVTQAHGRQGGYDIFKYAVYGAYEEPENSEKKQEPVDNPASA